MNAIYKQESLSQQLSACEDELFFLPYYFLKTQLEAVGHAAVQPSEFFLHQNSSSPLLIILRNEDIADHISKVKVRPYKSSPPRVRCWLPTQLCPIPSKVPHLLELKKTSCVQFAGIDEPDDVVNLTHQELFTRGGFVMFDRAALENLTLCMCTSHCTVTFWASWGFSFRASCWTYLCMFL